MYMCALSNIHIFYMVGSFVLDVATPHTITEVTCGVSCLGCATGRDTCTFSCCSSHDQVRMTHQTAVVQHSVERVLNRSCNICTVTSLDTRVELQSRSYLYKLTKYKMLHNLLSVQHSTTQCRSIYT